VLLPATCLFSTIAIVFRLFAFSASFVAFQIFAYFVSRPVPYCFGPLFSYPDYRMAKLPQVYDENTGLCLTPLKAPQILKLKYFLSFLSNIIKLLHGTNWPAYPGAADLFTLDRL